MWAHLLVLETATPAPFSLGHHMLLPHGVRFAGGFTPPELTPW